MAININREVEDAFYRYKMPSLEAKVEGKGNGIKTVVVNVNEIAKSLNQKPIYLTKYFGFELGAQTRVDENERYIVNGAHEAVKLQDLLNGFIKKFVLCQSCSNPETNMRVNKSGQLTSTCSACGCHSHLDPRHRLTQFITKNPPASNNSTKSKGKGKKSKNRDKNSDEDHEVKNVVDDSFIKSRVEQEDDDDWVEDTTEEAQMQRLNELSAVVKMLALSKDVEKSEQDRADVLYKHLLKLVEDNNVVGCERQIKLEADRLELGPRSILVAVDALLSNPLTLLKDIEKYSAVFKSLTTKSLDTIKAQYYALGAMVKIIERHNLAEKSCRILKQLYDHEVIEEDAIISWYDKGPSKRFVPFDLSAKILKACKPMVTWLKEAEEESDSDDDEEIPEISDQRIQFHSQPLEDKEATTRSASKDDDDDESDDEIDIDAI